MTCCPPPNLEKLVIYFVGKSVHGFYRWPLILFYCCWCFRFFLSTVYIIFIFDDIILCFVLWLCEFSSTFFFLVLRLNYNLLKRNCLHQMCLPNSTTNLKYSRLPPPSPRLGLHGPITMLASLLELSSGLAGFCFWIQCAPPSQKNK